MQVVIISTAFSTCVLVSKPLHLALGAALHMRDDAKAAELPVMVDRDDHTLRLVELLRVEVDQRRHGQAEHWPRAGVLLASKPQQRERAHEHLRLSVDLGVAVDKQAMRGRIGSRNDLMPHIGIASAGAPALWKREDHSTSVGPHMGCG